MDRVLTAHDFDAYYGLNISKIGITICGCEKGVVDGPKGEMGALTTHVDTRIFHRHMVGLGSISSILVETCRLGL